MIKFTLKALRKLIITLEPSKSNYGRKSQLISNKQYASDLIFNLLKNDDPVMISRLGSVELSCMVNYLGVYHNKFSIRKYLYGEIPEYWWNEKLLNHMKLNAGFFPNDVTNINAFCKLMIDELPNIDLLGSWLKNEFFFRKELSQSKFVLLEDLEPFFIKEPWTYALKNKKVLVVHPFAKTIIKQYENREKVHPNGLLPEFHLDVIQAVQTIAGEQSNFLNWFEALEHMKSEIREKEFDICIIGCGAYGLPLASFVKKLGKKAIHLGGVTQLLFGIKGARWEKFEINPYPNIMNEHWVSPSEDERPKNYTTVESGCYW